MRNNLSPDIKKSAFPFSPFSMNEIPYVLDRKTCYRSEPGCDDEPSVVTPLNNAVIKDIKALEARYREVEAHRKFVSKIKGLPVDESIKRHYLEHLTQTPISILAEAPKFNLAREISTSEKCSTVYNSLFGLWSGDFYHTLLHCMKFWCPFCGGKGKKINKRRIKLMSRKLNKGRTPKNRAEFRSAAGSWLVRQFIFTVPEKDRWRFMSWDGLNKLFGVVRRIIKDLFPGSRVEVYMHTIGKGSLSKFNPHVNVHIYLPKGSGAKLMLTPETLIAVKDRWARGLRKLGCSDVRGPSELIAGKNVDVQYLYASKTAKIMQKIRYMTRPLGPEHLTAWRQDPDGQEMMDLHVRQLKGFQFMRSWDRWAGCNYYDTEDVTKEVESVIDEPVEFVGFTFVSVINFKLEGGLLEKIGEDLYVERRKFNRNRSP
ncbi:hypothetical protein ES708_12866 [subsurface metagenome]